MTTAEAADRTVRHLMAISIDLYEGSPRVASRKLSLKLASLADELRHAQHYEADARGFRCVPDAPAIAEADIPY